MGNRNAGREAAPAASASRPSIASPAALAAHLGRDLSASAVDDGGWTDLHYAAAFGWPAVARALVIDGAPVDARLKTDAEPLGPQVLDTLHRYGRHRFGRLRRTGATPLHIASAADAGEVVAVLLAGGADGDVRESTPTPCLRRAGPNVGAATDKGVTLLHAAARRNAPAVPRVLLVPRGERPVGGRLGQHPAAFTNAAGAVWTLLDRGADVQATDAAGLTPLHLGCGGRCRGGDRGPAGPRRGRRCVVGRRLDAVQLGGALGNGALRRSERLASRGLRAFSG